MNLAFNLFRSTLLASFIFWLIIFTEDISIETPMFVLFSLIPIFICVSVVITGTICSIFWISKTNNFQLVFKHYFPYYSIIVFGISSYTIIVCDFEIMIVAFFSSAFITTSQTWVWFSKVKQNEGSH